MVRVKIAYSFITSCMWGKEGGDFNEVICSNKGGDNAQSSMMLYKLRGDTTRSI